MLEILHTALLLRCEGRARLLPRAAEGRQGPSLDTNALPTLAGPTGAGRGIPRPGAAPGPLPERRGCWKAIDSFWQRQRGKYFDHVTPHKRSSSLRVCNLHRRCHRAGTPPPPRPSVPASRQGNASIRHRCGKTAEGIHTSRHVPRPLQAGHREGTSRTQGDLAAYRKEELSNISKTDT